MNLLALAEGLDRTGKMGPQCQVVEMHCVGDLTQEEIAAVLGVSLSTVSGTGASPRSGCGGR